MLQPVIADELFGKQLFDGIGLTARMLLVAPDSTAGTRLYRDAPHDAAMTLAHYNNRLRFLLMRPPVTCADAPDALDPPALTLHPDARAAWITFYNQCETAVQPNGPLSRIRAFAGKLGEHAGRVAAVLTVYDNPDAMEIPFVAMQCGVALATHYANEMLRLADGSTIPTELRAAQKLLTWWQSLASPVAHLAMIYQLGPTDVRNAKAARAATDVLEDHGWIERLEPGRVIDGKGRKEAWRLVT